MRAGNLSIPEKQPSGEMNLRSCAVMWTHGVTIKETDPVMRYKVSDERGQEVAFITNVRASGRPASWQISRLNAGGGIEEPTGDYRDPEDALAALALVQNVETRIANLTRQYALTIEEDANNRMDLQMLMALRAQLSANASLRPE